MKYLLTVLGITALLALLAFAQIKYNIDIPVILGNSIMEFKGIK